MSDDELEKLAAAMKNISPSKAARKSGMDAAMAAFDTEFASETTVVTETVEENISETSQGLSDATRPTGQTIGTGPMASLGRDTMSKISQFFKQPKAMMMMGTCAAALFATSLYIPNTRFEEMPKPAAKAVTAEVDTEKAASDDSKVMADAGIEAKVSTDTVSEAKVTEPSIEEAPVTVIEPETRPAHTNKPSTNAARTATQVENRDREAKRQRKDGASLATRPTIRLGDSETADVVERSEAITIAPPETLTAEVVTPETPSNVVTIERRILKSPARTMERVIPAIPKTETRRRIKTPARTVERSIPAVTKQETRRVEKADGTFETVSETVVVKPASTDYVTVPPTYETYTETVVVQEASTELVTVPAEFETVSETVMINADGSTEVLSSEAVYSPSKPELPPGNPMPEIAASSDALAGFSTGAARADTGISAEAFAPAAEVLPAPAPTASTVDEVIVTGGKAKSSWRERRRARLADIEAAVPAFAPPPPAPAVSVPSELKSVELGKLPPGARIVERVIPAVTKTRTRRVVKTPASTVERVIPAITKDVTVQVENEDGTVTEVTKTFVIQPASVEYVSVPPVYETVTETIVTGGDTTELVMVDADGTVIIMPPVVKPKPQPRPQSGLLTAGDYDDVLNPDLYKVYLDKMLQGQLKGCLLYTSPSPRDRQKSRMPSSA